MFRLDWIAGQTGYTALELLCVPSFLLLLSLPVGLQAHKICITLCLRQGTLTPPTRQNCRAPRRTVMWGAAQSSMTYHCWDEWVFAIFIMFWSILTDHGICKKIILDSKWIEAFLIGLKFPFENLMFSFFFLFLLTFLGIYPREAGIFLWNAILTYTHTQKLLLLPSKIKVLIRSLTILLPGRLEGSSGILDTASWSITT